MVPLSHQLAKLLKLVDQLTYNWSQQHSVVEQTDLWLETESQKKESFLWCTGTSNCAHLGNSISWVVIGCWSVSGCISEYIPAGIFVLIQDYIGLESALFLSDSWTLAETLAAVNIIVIILQL